MPDFRNNAKPPLPVHVLDQVLEIAPRRVDEPRRQRAEALAMRRRRPRGAFDPTQPSRSGSWWDYLAGVSRALGGPLGAHRATMLQCGQCMAKPSTPLAWPAAVARTSAIIAVTDM